MTIKLSGTSVDKHNTNPFVTVALDTESATAFRHESSDCDTKNLSPSMLAPESQTDKSATTSHHEEQAVLLNAADAFFEMFCEQKHGSETTPAQDSAPVKGAIQSVFAGRFRGLCKLSAFFLELNTALGSEKLRRLALGLIAAGLCFAVLLASGSYLLKSPKREIALLLKGGHYDKGLAMSNDYLAHTPQDEGVQKLATEALIHTVVPEWDRLLEAKRFDLAVAIIRDSFKRSSANPEGVKLLALLHWISDLERFIFHRGGVGAPIMLFRDEDIMQNLLNRWYTSVASNKVMLVRISNAISRFQTIRIRVNSYLRVLQNEQKIYQKAIAELESNLKVLLISSEPHTAISRLDLFKETYSHITGTKDLSNDINRFVKLRQAVMSHNLQEVLRLHKTQYKTTLVDDVATSWIATHLPPEPGMSQYQAALIAWRDGHVNIALTLLNGLTDETWGEMARVKITRFSDIAKAFAELGKLDKSRDYNQRILSFYQALNVSEDTYFIEAIKLQVYVIREVVSAKAEQLSQEAMRHWNHYQASGGITGLLRLEKTVSKRFRQQTERLKAASKAVRHAAKFYSLTSTKIPAEHSDLHKAVQSEVMRQRQWLQDLGLVLESGLLKTKLQLLPNLTENEA